MNLKGGPGYRLQVTTVVFSQKSEHREVERGGGAREPGLPFPGSGTLLGAPGAARAAASERVSVSEACGTQLPTEFEAGEAGPGVPPPHRLEQLCLLSVLWSCEL